MHALEVLLLAVALVYLAECAVWVKRNTAAFRARRGRGRHIVTPLEWAGNESGGIALAGPLPPLTPLILIPLWPFSATAEGLCSYVSQTLQPLGRPRQVERHLAWDEVKEVAFDQKRVLVNGELFCEAISELQADHLAGTIEALFELTAGKREAALRKVMRETLDDERIRGRFDAFCAETLTLRISTNLFGAVILGVVPVMLYWPPLSRRWPFVVAFALAVLALVLLDYLRAHRQLYPGRKKHRRAHFWMCLLSPLAAIRACDVVARDLMADCHPLGVAHLLCTEQEFHRFARRMLADQRHPHRPVCESENLAARATEEGFRRLLTQEVERYLRRTGIPPEKLLAPPEREGERSLAYCPRCDGQYAIADGLCDACGGIPLVPFPA